MNAWGQLAGNRTVVHRYRRFGEVVAYDSRLAARGHSQGLSSAKALKTQAKMQFSTEGVALYY